jgi:hypothetical protein
MLRIERRCSAPRYGFQRKMNIRQLEVFLAVMDVASVTHAAEHARALPEQ